MRGHCLCGNVEFEIDRESLKLYQCHCSLCRQQSGTFSNAATIVPMQSFRFLNGQSGITSWVKDTGFRSDFCACCGSPVPNPLRDSNYYWVPAGLLENNGGLEIVSHIFLNSKADWDRDYPHAEMHAGFPGFDKHIQNLNE
jgi:hypothetical protein